jgi:hypothetical protein
MSTTTPHKRFTEKEMKKIWRDRRSGLWKTEDTLRDVNLSFAQHCAGGDDEKAVFLHRGTCMMMMMNQREMLEELKSWKKQGCVVDPENTREVELNGQKATMWILQPAKVDEDTPMCPVAMALGTLVSGFSYISKDKGVAELASRYLKKA